ncbi:unnamed protein product, partial [Prorocentrum cordatum]
APEPASLAGASRARPAPELASPSAARARRSAEAVTPAATDTELDTEVDPVDSLSAQAGQLKELLAARTADVEMARAEAEAAKAEAEMARAEAERASAEAERAKAEVERAKAAAESMRNELAAMQAAADLTDPPAAVPEGPCYARLEALVSELPVVRIREAAVGVKRSLRMGGTARACRFLLGGFRVVAVEGLDAASGSTSCGMDRVPDVREFVRLGCVCGETFPWDDPSVVDGAGARPGAKRRRQALPCGHWMMPSAAWRFELTLQDLEEPAASLVVHVRDQHGQLLGVTPDAALTDGAARDRVRALLDSLLKSGSESETAAAPDHTLAGSIMDRNFTVEGTQLGWAGSAGSRPESMSG